MTRQCEIIYSVVPQSSRFFCGAGVGRSVTDRTFVRDARGRVVIPGSHIKGVVRQACEDLLETLGHDVVSPHDHDRASVAEDLVSATFGRPEDADLCCFFSEIIVADDPDTEIRKRIRMDRRLGRPVAQHLFDTEYAISTEEEAEGRILLWLQDGGSAMPPGLTLVCASLRLVQHFGGDSSTGAGHVDLTLRSVTLDGESLAPADVLAPLAQTSWLDSQRGGD